MNISPQAEALAFRIWTVCRPKEWNCTCKEVADELCETSQRVSRVLQIKGWSSRLRSTHGNSFDLTAKLGMDGLNVLQGETYSEENENELE